jgi:hypothetical protein
VSAVEGTVLPFVERRALRRVGCAMEVTVRQRGRFAVAADTIDLTTNGCRVDGAGPFERDGEMWVRLPGLESQSARVVWSRGEVTGLAFAHPLHPAVYARFLPAEARLSLVSEAAGGVAPERSPVRVDKHPSGGGLAAMIRRQAVRQVEQRQEERFDEALRSGPMRLTVGAREAEVRTVSASGLRVAAALDSAIGEEVAVAFDGFEPMPGRVVWRSAEEAGLSLPENAVQLEDA